MTKTTPAPEGSKSWRNQPRNQFFGSLLLRNLAHGFLVLADVEVPLNFIDPCRVVGILYEVGNTGFM